jgi:hypothetical protein
MEDKMEIILGILLCVSIGISLGLYFNMKKTTKIPEIEPEKEEKPKLSREERKKREELRKHFENLMSYDYEQALKSKEE